VCPFWPERSWNCYDNNLFGVRARPLSVQDGAIPDHHPVADGEGGTRPEPDAAQEREDYLIRSKILKIGM
jgi:hypothetical protein